MDSFSFQDPRDPRKLLDPKQKMTILEILNQDEPIGALIVAEI